VNPGAGLLDTRARSLLLEHWKDAVPAEVSTTRSAEKVTGAGVAGGAVVGDGCGRLGGELAGCGCGAATGWPFSVSVSCSGSRGCGAEVTGGGTALPEPGLGCG
jgi:hypothetical protein